MKEIINIRQPIVEGLFYPDDPDTLKDTIEQLLRDNPWETINSNTLILPHGGWDYTGSYIAKGFNSLPDKNFSRIIIISNVHREFSNTIYLPEATSFKICNKNIPVDKEAVNKLKEKGKKVEVSNIPHMEEHGIETILPFVSNRYPKSKIVPILLGKTIVSLVRTLSNMIKEILDEDTLIIVSSNFSEYEKESRSEEIGKKGVDLTVNGKLSELVELTRTNKLKTCGAGAISSILLLKQHKEIVVLQEGLTPQTPLSGGKATYYGALTFKQ